MKRILLLASASLLFVATIPGIAEAHPAYKDSNPQAGSSVGTTPSELWVEFTERIEGGSVTITDPCGERADHGEDEMNLTSDRLTTGMHGDRAGSYLVQWSVLGSDGHNTRGQFNFTVSDGTSCPDPAEPKPEPEPDKEQVVKRERSQPSTETEDQAETIEDETDRRVAQRRSSENETIAERDRKPRNDVPDSKLEVAQSPTDTADTAGKSVWDGIPIGDFFIALTVAALIGAAGGRIYAGIIGPRR